MSQAPLPGGYELSAELYYIGVSQTADNGDKWVHGAVGEVMGPATAESHKGKGLDMKFAGNKGNVGCLLTNLSRSPPVRGAWRERLGRGRVRPAGSHC